MTYSSWFSDIKIIYKILFVQLNSYKNNLVYYDVY